jgi:predicted Zn-dependent protease
MSEVERTYVARFSDGKTAGSRDAKVQLTDLGVLIEPAGGGEGLLWPYDALTAADPLTTQSIDALLNYPFQPGAALFVPDKGFARALAERSPHLTARAQRMRAARPWLWTAAAAVCITGAIWLSGYSPAKTVARLLPDTARQSLGDQVVASMTRGRATCAAPAGVAALETLMGRLSKAAGTGHAFQVVVVDWDLFNAFATPGERIVVTRALIEKAASADEVAGVLAHEMGHGIELHPETGLVRGLGLAAAAELFLGGAGGSLANAGLLLTQLSYSRVAEREADQQALSILKAAEISPKGLLGFFDRLAGIEKSDGDSGFSVLRSHPQTKERREAVAAAAPYPASPALVAEDWTALKAICSVTEGGSEKPPNAPAPTRTTKPLPGETDI